MRALLNSGGCLETSRPTTHDDPVYAVDGIVHYCVANMPGAVPRTSTAALTNATIGYVCQMASLGIDDAFASDSGLAKGLNTRDGRVTYVPVAKAHAGAVPV